MTDPRRPDRGGRIIQSGDELVAVNGWKTWEVMSTSPRVDVGRYGTDVLDRQDLRGWVSGTLSGGVQNVSECVRFCFIKDRYDMLVHVFRTFTWKD